MKIPILLLFVFGVGLFIAAAFISSRQAGQFEDQRLAWGAEKKELVAALGRANLRSSGNSRSSTSSGRMPADLSASGPGAPALLNQLANLSVTNPESAAIRPVLVLLEQLEQMGPKALPSIRQFLASGSDVTYISSGNQGRRNVKSLVHALVPLTLRLALFDSVVRIGGKSAETILAEALSSTRSGLEVAYLTQVLEEIAPGLYQEAAIAAAGSLLTNGAAADRNLLFEVMKRFGDSSYVATAQRQMIQPDGKLDRNALRYLQQSLGVQSVAVAARTYQDARLAEPGSKEPLARVALAYVGTSEQALDLFHTALVDPTMLPDQTRNLVEDLNDDGLSNRSAPTPEDLKIIANRYALTQAYLQEDYVRNDKILNAAFLEADKDLRAMLDKAAAGTGPVK